SASGSVTAEVSVNTQVLGSFTANKKAPDYTEEQFQFTVPQSGQAVIVFKSTSSGSTGVVIDDVQLIKKTSVMTNARIANSTSNEEASDNNLSTFSNSSDLDSEYILRIYPNPVTAGRKMYLKFSGLITGTFHYVVSDVLGRVTVQKTLKIPNPIDQIEVDISLINHDGVYLIKIEGGNIEPEVIRFIIQKDKL
ncbi:MAG: T9SS type A sorting domain-containing protein, partial [Bacteroidota bacterium]